VRFGQNLYMPNWLSFVLALIPGLVMLWTGLGARRQRQAANLSVGSLSVLVVKAVVLTTALVAMVWYLAQGRGMPWMFGLFVLLVVVMEYAFTRTKWGRSMFAVGGKSRGGAARGHQRAADLPLGLRSLLDLRGAWRGAFGRAPRLLVPTGRVGRR
jgi:D-xylose transport system permease protein